MSGRLPKIFAMWTGRVVSLLWAGWRPVVGGRPRAGSDDQWKGFTMRKALTAIFLLGALAVPLAAGAQTTDVSEQDKTFLTGQQQTNLVEVSLGKTVMERTTNEKVRDLADHLVSDHQKVSQENTALSQKLGVTPPSEPSAEQKAMADKILAQSGDAFDRAYVDAQVEGHMKSIEKANKEISSGSNPDVKAFATSYVPKAQSHLDMSRTVQSQLSGTEAARGTDGLPRTGRSTGLLAGLGTMALFLGLGVVRLSRRSDAASS
jgi:putative membrane protein